MEQANDSNGEDLSDEAQVQSDFEIEKVEVVDQYVRYSIIDAQGNKYCVGGRLEGFFDHAEMEAISEIDMPE